MTIQPLRFSANLVFDTSVNRDWGLQTVQNLGSGLRPIVGQLPEDIIEVKFVSVSGEGMTTRALAYDDLWLEVLQRGSDQPKNYLVTDGLHTAKKDQHGILAKALTQIARIMSSSVLDKAD